MQNRILLLLLLLLLEVLFLIFFVAVAAAAVAVVVVVVLLLVVAVAVAAAVAVLNSAYYYSFRGRQVESAGPLKTCSDLQGWQSSRKRIICHNRFSTACEHGRENSLAVHMALDLLKLALNPKP